MSDKYVSTLRIHTTILLRIAKTPCRFPVCMPLYSCPKTAVFFADARQQPRILLAPGGFAPSRCITHKFEKVIETSLRTFSRPCSDRFVFVPEPGIIPPGVYFPRVPRQCRSPRAGRCPIEATDRPIALTDCVVRVRCNTSHWR
jgi:hypothetical protein